MSCHHRGVYITLLAAAWDNGGWLPLPVDLAARSARLDPRSLRDFLAKSPRSFVKIGSKLVNKKLQEQWAKYQGISEKRKKAAQSRYPANAEQMDHSASAVAFASASAQLKPPHPNPPATSREGTGLADYSLQVYGELVVIRKPANRRLWTQREQNGMQGKRAEDHVEFFQSKGFKAWIEPATHF